MTALIKSLRGGGILLFAALLWGVGNAITGLTASKYATSRSFLPAIDISMANTLGGLCVLLLCSALYTRRRERPSVIEAIVTRPSRFSHTLLAGLFKGINTCLFVLSTAYIIATESLVFESSYIVWSVALGVLYSGRRLPFWSLATRTVILLAGVMLVSGVGARKTIAVDPKGAFLGLAAGITYAGFLFAWSNATSTLTTFRSQLKSTVRMLMLSAIAIFFVTQIAARAVYGIWWIPFREIAVSDVIVQLINGVLVIGAVYLLVTIGMAEIRDTRDGSGILAAACLSFSIPFTLLTEILLRRAAPAPTQLVGIGLFMFGFVWLTGTLTTSSQQDRGEG